MDTHLLVGEHLLGYEPFVTAMCCCIATAISTPSRTIAGCAAWPTERWRALQALTSTSIGGSNEP
jgi:hypothetical protein